MGQKVSPIGFRLGINKTWESRWFRSTGYAEWLKEDMAIRRYVFKNCKSAAVSRVEIERAADRCKVNLFSARPGVLIGKKGTEIETFKKSIQKLSKSEVFLNIHEVRKPEIDANLVAQKVAQELERRVAFRRAMKKVMSTAQKFGVQGVKVMCSGRLGGAEMSRCEWYREGRVPLHTLRADIDYGFAEADTTYGKIGCRVWLFKGEVLSADAAQAKRQES
jgi:small subunit ribosomal protein S3